MKHVDCIACSKTMESVLPEGRGIQPLGGLAFCSHGHYGSSYFDPMDGSFIEIAVCDECLSKTARGVNLFPSLDAMEEKP